MENDFKLRNYFHTLQMQLARTWETCDDDSQFHHEANGLFELIRQMDAYVLIESDIFRTMIKLYNAYIQSLRAYRAFAAKERKSNSALSSKEIARKRYDEFYNFISKYV